MIFVIPLLSNTILVVCITAGISCRPEVMAIYLTGDFNQHIHETPQKVKILDRDAMQTLLKG